MSKLVIYRLLHSEILRLLESYGANDIALEVERREVDHDLYDFLERALSAYFANYGGLNCDALDERLRRSYSHVVGTLLPRLVREYVRIRCCSKEVHKRLERQIEVF